ncbi:MAG TPA: hypothetical protein EYG03_10460 [Planctomycetes bacterium]|nr:hypothetical protein [Fuerstiella sp.]HIK92389.1 hypothetical protein [Planctomycetota bacterium]
MSAESIRPLLRIMVVVPFTGSFLLLSGCGGSYSGTSDYEKFKQQEQGFSVDIEAAGGTATREGKSMYGIERSGWLVDLSGAEINDALITSLTDVAQKDAVFQLNLSNSKITDDQLAKLDAGKVFQKMVELNLSNTAITDAGLDKLSNFHCITDLNLKGSKATKAGATRLGKKQIANPDTPPPFKKQPKLTI